MNNESTLQEMISETILFFDRNKKLIILFTLSGFIIAFVSQKLKKDYFSTTAIATSGLAAYERFQDKDILNQRTAINMINNLQLDIAKEDYKALSHKLDIPLDDAYEIKYIEAEQLFREDDDNLYNTPKFFIHLEVYKQDIISDIQKGLMKYFSSNTYMLNYQNNYNQTNTLIIESIDTEINDLRSRRSDPNYNSDMSTLTILSSNSQSSQEKMDIQNQIVNLTHQKAVIMTNNNMLQPLTFVDNFTQTTSPKTDIIVWGSAMSFISFLLSIVIAIIREVKRLELKVKK